MPAETTPTTQDIMPPPGTPQIPMHYEGGIIVPGHVTGQNVNINNNGGNTLTANPNITVGGAVGGAGASGNLEQPTEVPAGPEEEPAVEPEDQPDELDELRQQLEEREQRIGNLEEQVRQMNEQLSQLVELLQNQPTTPPPGELPPPGLPQEEEPQQSPEQQAFAEADAEVGRLRDQLAQFTILRRARSFDFGTRRRREDAEAYENMLQEYNEVFNALQVARGNLLHANGEGDHERIIDQCSQAEYDEQRLFAQRVFDIDKANYEQGQQAGGMRAWYERNLRKWANYSTKKKLLIGLAIGVGAGVASGTLGLGLFGLAAGVAARYSIGILNHNASARNVSEKSLRSEKMRITREQQREDLGRMRRRSVLALTRPEDVDAGAFVGGTMDRVEGRHRGELGRARRRNRLGLAILGASGALTGLGIAELAGAGGIPDFLRIPGIDSLWHHAHNVIPGGGHSHNIAANLHNDTIYAHNPHEFVNGAFNLLGRQGIHAHGLTPDKITAISHDMMANHWHIASGMEAAPGGGLHQHVVDVAKDWSGGHTGNYRASAAEAFQNTAQLRRFMSLAQQHGVTFTRG